MSKGGSTVYETRFIGLNNEGNPKLEEELLLDEMEIAKGELRNQWCAAPEGQIFGMVSFGTF